MKSHTTDQLMQQKTYENGKTREMVENEKDPI